MIFQNKLAESSKDFLDLIGTQTCSLRKCEEKPC